MDNSRLIHNSPAPAPRSRGSRRQGLFRAIVLVSVAPPPDSPLTGDDVSDFVDRAINDGGCHRAGSERKEGRAAPRDGTEDAHVGAVRRDGARGLIDLPRIPTG